MKARYNRRQPKVRDIVRVVTELPAETVKLVDEWGIPAGKRSRTAAFDELLRRGLQSVQAESPQAS